MKINFLVQNGWGYLNKLNNPSFRMSIRMSKYMDRK